MTEVAARPKLTLGLKTVPLKLQAYRSKIGLEATHQDDVGIIAPRLVDSEFVADHGRHPAQAASPRACYGCCSGSRRNADVGKQIGETQAGFREPQAVQEEAQVYDERNDVVRHDLVRPDCTKGVSPRSVAGDPPPDIPPIIMPVAATPKRLRKSALPWPPRARLFPAIELPGEPVPVEATRTYASPNATELAARYWCRAIAWEVGNAVPELRRRDAETFVLRHRPTIENAFSRRLKKAVVVEAILKWFSFQSIPTR